MGARRARARHDRAGQNLKLCNYRKLLLAEHKQRKPRTTQARNLSASEPEGELELSPVEEAIAKNSYCVAKAGGAGLGVFALKNIPAGSFLWMYEGKRMRTGDRNANQAARYIARQGGHPLLLSVQGRCDNRCVAGRERLALCQPFRRCVSVK